MQDIPRIARTNAEWYKLISSRTNKTHEQHYVFLGDQEYSFDAVLPARLLEEEYGELQPPFTQLHFSGETKIDVRVQEETADAAITDREWKQFSTSHFLFFNITYHDGAQGLFVYVRSSLTGDESPEWLLALRNFSPFPNHPTSEQLCDPTLVELYRKLGLHLADRLCFFLCECLGSDIDVFTKQLSEGASLHQLMLTLAKNLEERRQKLKDDKEAEEKERKDVEEEAKQLRKELREKKKTG